GNAPTACHLESDAFLVCISHALSTEKEEVMGLCIGELEPSRVVHVHSDRVEISPEQLSAASTEAERLADSTGRPMRAMYQMLDQSFVGLIFSCFIEDKNTRTGRVLYTCFQSTPKGQEYERLEIPIHVLPREAISKACLDSAVELPRILCQEEQDTYRKIHALSHLDPVTRIHNGSVFTKNLCSQMAAVSGPLLQWLEHRLSLNQRCITELQRERERLREELEAL
uniref:BRCA1/BRCA2-containing complex, subunit 3 n=1 Tax=Neogobius melanostomus TaxID=47308 RepID=A0A8C6TW18_9GOBI